MTDEESRREDHRVDATATGLTAKLVLGTDKTVIECVVSIRDFSKGGASLFTSFKAASGTVVKLMLEGVTSAWIDGTVAWCTPAAAGDAAVPAGSTHQVGISFKPKDKAAQASLAQAFEHFSKLADEADALDDDEL